MDLKVRSTSGYKKISLEESLEFLETSMDGLKEAEAMRRLEVFGYNEITERKKNPFLDFLLRYWGPMPWLLELAMGLSFVLRHYLEGIIIFALLTVNAIIGHMHSRGSQKAVELLKKKLAIKAKVLRDGNGMLSATDNLFCVIVPVLSKQRTSIEAASSIESSLVTSAPFFASSIAPTDWTMVRTAGRATGTAPIRKITAKVSTSSIPKFITSA